MSLTASILGAIFGLLFGGFPGLLLGFFLGYTIDSRMVGRWRSRFVNASGRDQVRSIFFDSTFKVMGYLSKSDGRVTEREIKAAESVMHQMGLDAEMRRRAIESFNLGKQSDFNLRATLKELRSQCWHNPSLLKAFLEIQMQLASADGRPSPRKNRALQEIYEGLGIFGFNFGSFEERFRTEQNYQRYQGYQSQGNSNQYNPQQQLREAYEILGVPQSAAQAEVKKAYRKLMSQNHPDRLIAKGVPEQMIKMATAKTQKIKQAYEDICKAKGWP